jgi:hypothetical protein
MPGRVVLVLVLLALYTVFLLYSATLPDAPPQAGVFGVLSVVFVIFLARGHPLARQWAQYIAAILLVVAITLGALMAPERADPAWWIGFGLTGLIGAALLWGLSGPEARKFFDLYCGHCKSYKVRAASLLFNLIKCRECGRKWDVHDSRVDAEVFD